MIHAILKISTGQALLGCYLCMFKVLQVSSEMSGTSICICIVVVINSYMWGFIKINSNWHMVYFGTSYTWHATFICLFKWLHSNSQKWSLNCRLPQNWVFQDIKNLRKTFEGGNLNTWELTFSPYISLGYSANGLHIQERNLHFGDAEIS